MTTDEELDELFSFNDDPEFLDACERGRAEFRQAVIEFIEAWTRSVAIIPDAIPASEDDAARRKELYQFGPWLVVFGHGAHSEARARQIADQCHARGVDLNLVPVEEVAEFDLSYYVALIVVLPSKPPKGGAVLPTGKIVQIIKAYRARRPDGLDSLLDGSRRWFQVGVVQVSAPMRPTNTRA